MILKVTAIAAVVAAAVAGASPATGEPGCRAALAARGYTFTATTVDGVPQPNCAAATVSDAFGSVVRRMFLRSGLTLSGTLLDSTGAPASAVPVVVQAGPLAGGAPATVAQATTDAKGRYALAVAEGESRLLTVQAGGGERMVEELVAPSVWLSVRARRHARLLFFGGLIDGGATPQPTVTLQDRTPQGWRTFAAVAPRAAGRHAGRFPTCTAPRPGRSATRSRSARPRCRRRRGNPASARSMRRPSSETDRMEGRRDGGSSHEAGARRSQICGANLAAHPVR